MKILKVMLEEFISDSRTLILYSKQNPTHQRQWVQGTSIIQNIPQMSFIILKHGDEVKAYQKHRDKWQMFQDFLLSDMPIKFSVLLTIQRVDSLLISQRRSQMQITPLCHPILIIQHLKGEEYGGWGDLYFDFSAFASRLCFNF